MGKRPGFTALVVGTLALGIGANTALFSVVRAVLIEPLPFRDSARIAMLSEHSRTMDTGLVSPITFEDWQGRNQAFSELAAFRYWENRTLEITPGQSEPILQVTATPNYFRVLGFAPLFGRTHGEEHSGANEVVLSYGLWKRRFGGSRQVLGTTVRIAGAAFIVVGVMPAGPRDLAIGWGDVWTPLHRYNMQVNRATSYRSRYVRVLARLKPDVTLAQAQARMDTLQHQLEKEATSVAAGYSVRVESLEHALTGRFRPALLVLLGAVTFVLLTACANVANLLLARGVAREKERAVRIGLGAGRARLFRETLLESGALSLLGALLGLAGAYGGLAVLKHALAAQMPRLAEAELQGPVLLFTLGLAAASALFFSLVPLGVMGYGSVHDTLKEAGRTGGGGTRHQQLRTILVAAEFAFAVLLLVGAGLLLKSFTRLLQVHPGFESSGRVTADVILLVNQYSDPARRTLFYRTLFRRLAETPGVQASGGSLYFPCRGKLWLSTIWREGVPVPMGEEAIVYYNLYAGDYFRAMGIPLLRGRLLTERELWEPSDAVVINEVMARQVFGNVDPLRSRIQTDKNGPWSRIVGIVGNVRQKSLDEEPKAELYEPFSRMPMTFLTVVAHTQVPLPTALGIMRRAVSEIDAAAVPPSIVPLAEVAGNTVTARRLASLLMLLSAALALILSALGAYGALSYAVNQRTAEIGVRMAVGATPSDVLRLIVGQGLRTAAMGTLVGLLLALAGARALATLLYEVYFIDPSLDAAVATLAIAMAFLASYFPARRAMRVDPLLALRHG